MFGIHTYGSLPFSMISGGDTEAGGSNYRHLILTALKQNLEAITIANGFRAEIKGVQFGGAESRVQNGEVLIYGIRDAAVINTDLATDPANPTAGISSYWRNIYVKFRLLVKGELCSGVTSEMLELRENYTDALIKGLYGRNANARQLHSLLMEGISAGSGLAEYNILQFKDYGFSGDLQLEAEAVFTYKENF